MELADYLRLLKRYWSGALMIVLASNLVAGLYAAFTPPTYESTSQLYVSLQTQDGSASTLLQGSNYTQDLVAAFADLATSPLVLDPVVAELDLETSASGLARSVSASAKLNTPLINLTVSAPTADEAAILSNAVAQSMAAVLPELQRPLDSDISPVRITMTRAGQVPSSPTEPNVKLTLAVGLLVGVGLGITYAILRGVLDNKVRSIDDVEHITDKPVLGVVSIDKGAPSAPLAIIDAPHTPRSEEMRRLRTNVQFIAATGRARTIMVTSSLPAEGKSTTAANLALALADTGQRVLLVDADLRKPRVAKLFGLEGSVGLSTLFTGRVKAADCIQVVAGTSLEVITSGQIPPNPSELLGSNQMQEVLAELSNEYDFVVVDSAPVLPVTDAVALSPFVDGVVLLASATISTRSTLEHSLDALEQVDTRILGLVLNQVNIKEQSAYAHGYGYGELQTLASPRRRYRAELAELAETEDAQKMQRTRPRDLLRRIPILAGANTGSSGAHAVESLNGETRQEVPTEAAAGAGARREEETRGSAAPGPAVAAATHQPAVTASERSPAPVAVAVSGSVGSNGVRVAEARADEAMAETETGAPTGGDDEVPDKVPAAEADIAEVDDVTDGNDEPVAEAEPEEADVMESEEPEQPEAPEPEAEDSERIDEDGEEPQAEPSETTETEPEADEVETDPTEADLSQTPESEVTSEEQPGETEQDESGPPETGQAEENRENDDETPQPEEPDAEESQSDDANDEPDADDEPDDSEEPEGTEPEEDQPEGEQPDGEPAESAAPEDSHDGSEALSEVES